MGWRRRHRARPGRCTIKARRQAHAKGPAALAAFTKLCGPLAGIPRRRVRRKGR